jgi:hypothetical protein
MLRLVPASSVVNPALEPARSRDTSRTVSARGLVLSVEGMNPMTARWYEADGRRFKILVAGGLSPRSPEGLVKLGRDAHPAIHSQCCVGRQRGRV